MRERILYVKLKEKAKLATPRICLGDVAQVMCGDRSYENKLEQLRIGEISTVSKHKTYRKVITIFDVIKALESQRDSWEIVNLGNSELVVEYDFKKVKSPVWEGVKLTVVCVLIFFGAAFTIMAFNNDISITGVFEQVYLQFTGREKPQVSELEVAYSLGLFLGITVFFNHVGHKKLTNDVTPIEVELNKHMKDRMETIIALEQEKEGAKDGS